MAALFDLAHEFFDGQPLRSLWNVQRKLEHWCVSFRKGQNEEKVLARIAKEGPAEEESPYLNEQELFDDALLLLRTVRAAIFYLFHFVRKVP